MTYENPRLALLASVKPSKIVSRFEADCERVQEASQGVIDLKQVVQFAFGIPIGMPGWNTDGTIGLNGGESFFGVTPEMIPGWCGDFTQMSDACTSVVKIAGGATRLMLHLGLHGVAGGSTFKHDAITFDNLEPWLNWEARMRECRHDTSVSWDPTLWGGPDPDGLTLGSPNETRRTFFIQHLISGFEAMIEFAKKRSGDLEGVSVDSNIWLSGATARPWPKEVAVIENVIRSLKNAFDAVSWKKHIWFSHEGKAPPVQQAADMEVDTYTALLLAQHFNQAWLLDIGHVYPLEKLSTQLKNAMAFGLPLGAHLTFDPCGSDADLTIGLNGPVREFTLRASRLEGEEDWQGDLEKTEDLKRLLALRQHLYGKITWGIDTFEGGMPPELALLQGIMTFRALTISAFTAPVAGHLLAQESGNPVERVLAIIGEDQQQSIDLPNCLAWGLVDKGLDPHWAKSGVEAFLKRTNA